MVRVENPAQGQRAEVDARRAQKLIAEGQAVSTVTSGGFVLQIRMCAVEGLEQQRRRERAATARNYDALGEGLDDDRSFADQLPGVPVVQASKMIRMEKSSRNFSYVHSVKRSVRRDHSAKEVAAMRAMR